MRPDRSNRATGLLLDWTDDPGTAAPAHHRLAAALRAQVADGRLRSGDRLPPTRVLAEELGLSRWVVTEAYDQLKAEGYLTARVGSGTVVTGTGSPGEPPAAGPPAGDREPVPARPTRPALAPSADGPAPLDLSPALPDLASFPRTTWRAALTKALATATDADLGHPDPAGSPLLRDVMAGYLRRVRGLDVDADQVFVTQGVRQAVALVVRTLHAAGARRVAVEDPSWPRTRAIARAAGLDVVGVPVDAQGMRVDVLTALDREQPVDAVVVTPTHQFPSGVPLSAHRRLELLAWAARGGRTIVEDDYDAEFRYDRRPVGALAGRDPEHVVYLGSTSKTLTPGGHLGWMVAPRHLHGALATTREAIGALPPTLDQIALAHLVADGGYTRHLRRMRRHYGERRAAMLAALTAELPGRPAPSMEAGLHVLWLLPDDLDEDAAVARIAGRRLLVLGLGPCRTSPGPPGLVIGYGNVAPHRAPEIARTLAAGLRDT